MLNTCQSQARREEASKVSKLEPSWLSCLFVVQVDFLIDAAIDFFRQEVQEEGLCTTLRDDPITPFKRSLLVWNKLRHFLDRRQPGAEAQSLQGVSPALAAKYERHERLEATLAATRSDVDTLTALYRCASAACDKGMKEMRNPPEEDPEQPRVYEAGEPRTEELVDYNCLRLGLSLLFACSTFCLQQGAMLQSCD